ncbi:hypothetical protein C2G38_2118375, partial [Gigaspora rosea]
MVMLLFHHIFINTHLRIQNIFMVVIVYKNMVHNTLNMLSMLYKLNYQEFYKLEIRKNKGSNFIL